MWISVTESHVLTKISGPELAAFKASALGAGQTGSGVLADTILEVVNECRGYIAACQRNRLGEGNTIPEKLLNAALSLIVLRIMDRAAGTIIDPNDQRKKNGENAIRLLEQVAACKFGIDQPDDVSSEVIQNFKPSYNDNGRTRSFRDQSGI